MEAVLKAVPLLCVAIHFSTGTHKLKRRQNYSTLTAITAQMISRIIVASSV